MLRRIVPHQAIEILHDRVRKRNRIAGGIGRLIEAATQHAREFRPPIGFAQKLHVEPRVALQRDHAMRVSGGEQDLEGGPQFGNLVGQLPAIHVSGHDDVGEQKIELGARFDDRERFGRIVPPRSPCNRGWRVGPSHRSAPRCRPPRTESFRTRRAFPHRLAASICRGSLLARGRTIRKVAPFPTSLRTSMVPPDCFAKPNTMLRPSPLPVPTFLVEKNGSNILSRMASGMPVPLSITSTTT